MPQPGRADIAALAQRLQGGSAAEQAAAAAALLSMYDSCRSHDADGIAAAIAAAVGIPALIQLVGSRGEHPCAADATGLLSRLASDSPARCRAIIAGDGIAPMVSCLESSSQQLVQVEAAKTLSNLASMPPSLGGDNTAAVAAAAIPAAVKRLSSPTDGVAGATSALLANLADTPRRQRAIADADAIPLLVRLLRRPNQDVAAQACGALANLRFPWDSPADALDAARRTLAINTAGGIPALVQLLATSSHPHAVEAAAVVSKAMLRSLSVADTFLEAGAVAALVRCLQGRQFTSDTHENAAQAISLLASARLPAGAAKAVVDGGGARALVQVLARPSSTGVKTLVAAALCTLVCKGQAAAVVAADPTDAVGSALDWLPSSPRFDHTVEKHMMLAEAASLLNAARRTMRAAGTATAPPAAPSAAAAAQPAARPPRVCAAPGCGATSGLKRCAGCGSVRYCGEACQRAHWKEHRPECKRLRAAAAAAAGGAGPSGRA